MEKIFNLFERVIIIALIVLISIVILLATIDLGWIILKGVLSPPLFLLAIDDILETFGAFLLVLVGLELLETIKAYLSDHVIHAEVVFMAAMIAVARKVITLDLKEFSPLTLMGVAALILALTAGYFLFKQIHRNGQPH